MSAGHQQVPERARRLPPAREVARQHEHRGDLGELRRLADLVAADRRASCGCSAPCPPRCRPPARCEQEQDAERRRAPAPATRAAGARSGTRPSAGDRRRSPSQTNWRIQTPGRVRRDVGLPGRVEHRAGRTSSGRAVTPRSRRSSVGGPHGALPGAAHAVGLRPGPRPSRDRARPGGARCRPARPLRRAGPSP